MHVCFEDNKKLLKHHAIPSSPREHSPLEDLFKGEFEEGIKAACHYSDYSGRDMKTKSSRGRYRLSPNEEAQLMKNETEKRRKLRLLQVREQSKQNAAQIRQAVRNEKERQIQKLAAQLQDQLEKEKEEKVHKLEEKYENSLKSIGQGHSEAGQQVDKSEELKLLQQEDNRRADARGRVAIEKMKRDNILKEFEEMKQIRAREAALSVEKERAAQIAALPPPPADPLLEVDLNTKKPVKMTDATAFSTTHFHMLDEYAVDKADPEKQEDARLAAEEEGYHIQQMNKEVVQLQNDRLARARVRHNIALEKELLRHDYDNILMDLSSLQRADRERRQKIVANIPKQVYEPPYRRMADKEDKQKDMEEAFEDIYMAETKYLGDISLALDPHPPPETPTGEESLDVSNVEEASAADTAHQNTKDMGNASLLSRSTATTANKKPEKMLRKLMDKIKNQRQEWLSKTVQEIPNKDIPNQTEDETKARDQILTNGENHEITLEKAPSLSEHSLADSDFEPRRRYVQPVVYGSAGGGLGRPGLELHPMEKAAKQKQTNIPPSKQWHTYPDSVPIQSTDSQTSIDQILEQQRALEEQKKQLEAKLKELNAQQVAFTKSKAQPNVPYSQPPSMTTGVTPAPPTSHIGSAEDKSTSFYGISKLPTHFTKTSPSHSFIQSLPDPSVPKYDIPASKPTTQPLEVFSSGTEPGPLPVGAYLSSAAQNHPAAYRTTQNIPEAPQTIHGVMLPSDTLAESQDHLRKVKEYQQQLLRKHEQSKKILAETRAEIERRRQELLERFPHLDMKTPPSGSAASSEHGMEDGVQSIISENGLEISISTSQQQGLSQFPAQPQMSSATLAATVEQPAKKTQGGQASPPSKSAISALLTRLASHPYYVSRLSHPEERERLVATGLFPEDILSAIGANGSAAPATTTDNFNEQHLDKKEPMSKQEKIDRIRKSLPFDESLQDSPLTAVQKHGYDIGDKSMMDDSVMSSSTERGSPKLPASRRSDQSSESEPETSIVQLAKSRNELFEKRQADLRQQLDEIQRQKEEIMSRHRTGQMRLMEEQEHLKNKLARAQQQIQQDEMEDQEESNFDKTSDQEEIYREDSLGTDRNQQQQHDKKTLLMDHRPHELSTIQEVDTPGSGGKTGRHSLGSSDGSLARRSLDFNQHPSIPEEIQSPTNRRIAGDTGYQTDDVQEILNRAREFDEATMERVKQMKQQQMSDVFNGLKGIEEYGNKSEISNNQWLMGSFTPSSMSGGPLDESSLSSSSQQPPMTSHLQSIEQPNSQDESVQSQPSNKSWADEFASYQNSTYQPMDMEDVTARHSNNKFELSEKNYSYDSDLSQHTLSEKSHPSGSKDGSMLPSPAYSIDRKYDVVRLSVEPTQEYRKSDFLSQSGLSKEEQIFSLSGSEMSKDSIEQLAEELARSNSPHHTTSSTASGGSKVRKSPVGHQDIDLILSSDTEGSRAGQSDKSGVSEGFLSSGSSMYMDMELFGRAMTDYGPMRIAKDREFIQIGQNMKSENQQVPDVSIPVVSQTDSFFGLPTGTGIISAGASPALSDQDRSALVGNSREFSAMGEISGNVDYTSTPNNKLTEIQPLARLSEVTEMKTPESGIIPIGHSAKHNEPSHLGSLENSSSSGSYREVLGMTESEDRPTLSQHSLKSDTQAITLIGKSTEEDRFRDIVGGDLSQHTINTTGKSYDSKGNDSSLTQITMATEDSEFPHKDKSAGHLSTKTDPSLSQYTLNSDNNEPGHSITQYSLDRSSPGIGNVQLASPSSTQELSQYSLGTGSGSGVSSPGSDDAAMERKFANLDQLIAESRNIIAKHKEMVNKQSANQNQNQHVGMDFDEELSAPNTARVSSTFDVTEDTTPMQFSEESHRSNSILTSGRMDSEMYEQLGDGKGIIEEPDISLVSAGTGEQEELSQYLDPTNKSLGSDSTTSFEQHEAMCSMDTPRSFPVTPREGEEEEREDTDSENIFHAVPVMVSPTVCLTATFSSQQDVFRKPPVSWSTLLSSEDSGIEGASELLQSKQPIMTPKALDQTETSRSQTLSSLIQMGLHQQPKQFESDFMKNVYSAEEKDALTVKGSSVNKTSGKTVGKPGTYLNNALKPKSGPGSKATNKNSSPTWGSKGSISAAKTSGAVVSLGDFLKKQKPDEKPTLKQTVVTKGNRPTSVPSSGKQGEEDKSGVVKSVGPTGLSQTLASWKKSRGVKSAAPPPQPVHSREPPVSAVRVLPKEAPVISSSREEPENYDRHLRNSYELECRLTNKLAHEKNDNRQAKSEDKRQSSAASNREKVKEFQKKLQENMKKKEELKKQKSQTKKH